MLEFDPTLDELRKTKELRDGLSVVVQIGETLWVTNCSPRSPGPAAVEADLEGLAYANGYLRLVGSHSRKRGQAVAEKPVRKNLKKLADVDTDPNRWLLARIPVVEVAECWYWRALRWTWRGRCECTGGGAARGRGSRSRWWAVRPFGYF